MPRNTLFESAQRQIRATRLSIILLTPPSLAPQHNTHICTVTAVWFSFICCARGFIISNLALCQFDGLTYMLRHGTETGNSRKARRICQGQLPREHVTCDTTFVFIGRWIQETGKLQIRKPDFEIRRNVRSTCTWSEDILSCDEESPSNDSHSTVHDAGVEHTSTLTVCRQQ
jgi:hypothetical protein